MEVKKYSVKELLDLRKNSLEKETQLQIPVVPGVTTVGTGTCLTNKHYTFALKVGVLTRFIREKSEKEKKYQYQHQYHQVPTVPKTRPCKNKTNLMQFIGLLNKINIDNYERISSQVVKMECNVEEISFLVNKGCSENLYTEMYARLCQKISETKSIQNELYKLINEKFRKHLREVLATMTTVTENETPIGMEIIGTSKFITELFNSYFGNRESKTKFISHKNINELIATIKSISFKESLTVDQRDTLISIIYEIIFLINKQKFNIIDHLKFLKNAKHYWYDTLTLENTPGKRKISSRIKFMITNLLELKENNWIPKHIVHEKQRPTKLTKRRKGEERGSSHFHQFQHQSQMKIRKKLVLAKRTEILEPKSKGMVSDKRIECTLLEYITNTDYQELILTLGEFKEVGAIDLFVEKAVDYTIGTSVNSQNKMFSLFERLQEEDQISANVYSDCIDKLIKNTEELKIDIPKIGDIIDQLSSKLNLGKLQR